MTKQKAKPGPNKRISFANILTGYMQHTQNLRIETGLRLLAQAVDRLADQFGIDWDDIGEIRMKGPSITHGRAHRKDWLIEIESKDAVGFKIVTYDDEP